MEIPQSVHRVKYCNHNDNSISRTSINKLFELPLFFCSKWACSILIMHYHLPFTTYHKIFCCLTFPLSKVISSVSLFCLCWSEPSFNSLFIVQLQNVKAVFDSAIKVVIKPPQKQKEKKKKPRRGFTMLVPLPLFCIVSLHSFIILTCTMIESPKDWKLLLGQSTTRNT